MTYALTVEWLGTFAAVTGSFLNANCKYRLSYWVWTVSNVFFVAMALLNGLWGLLVTQVIFVACNVNGLIVQHRLQKAAAAARLEAEGQPAG